MTTSFLPLAVVAVVLVVAVLVALVVVVVLFAWPGLARRRRTAAELSRPAVPPAYPRALRDPAEGTYRGTRREPAGEQVRAHGLGRRGHVRLVLAAEGLVLDRGGADDLLIEQREMRASAERDGMLVVRWLHDGVPLETVVELGPDGDVAGWVASLEQMGRQQ